MEGKKLYSRQFLLMERISYFMVFIPWLPDLIKRGNTIYEPFSLFLKIFLSSALLVFIFFLRDIRRKINLLDDLKKNLSLAAIHDLKGPLTSIVGALSIISDSEIDPMVREKLLKVAAGSSQAQCGLWNSTLIDASTKRQGDCFCL
ncbi:MAG: hypothetical protein Fur0012_07630 [Elusimicrobiota bacterium]